MHRVMTVFRKLAQSPLPGYLVPWKDTVPAGDGILLLTSGTASFVVLRIRRSVPCFMEKGF